MQVGRDPYIRRSTIIAILRDMKHEIITPGEAIDELGLIMRNRMKYCSQHQKDRADGAILAINSMLVLFERITRDL